MSNKRGEWIQVYSGGKFYPMDPRPEEIHIRDIAHALANTCRFTGHVREFYSVAQHSVKVSYHCDSEYALWGLLHDAAEAYLVDLPSPVKQAIRAEGVTIFDELEERIMRCVCERFELVWPQPEIVKKADVLLAATEARDLMAPLSPDWKHTPENGYPVLPQRIIAFASVIAESLFLRRFEELTKGA